MIRNVSSEHTGISSGSMLQQSEDVASDQYKRHTHTHAQNMAYMKDNSQQNSITEADRISAFLKP